MKLWKCWQTLGARPQDAHTVGTGQCAREIGRFTVRRTKASLNELVDREPDAYVHPTTGRVCRYPQHITQTYRTGESPADEEAATEIRSLATRLTGVARLAELIAVPPQLRNEYRDDRWLQFCLVSTRGLAGHAVLAALRSSRAALVEHLLGGNAAAAEFALEARFKASDTGNVIGRLGELARRGPPRVDLAAPCQTG